MSLSSMITLPPSSAKGLYSCWNAYSRVASPATSYSLSPPISPPSSPSRMFPTYGRLSPPPASRPSSPLHTISEVLTQRASWPVSPLPLPLSDRQNSSDNESRSSFITNSMSYTYSVKSINSRKSRLAVWYPRPVRPQRISGVESIPESVGTSLESPSPLSSRPVSMSMSLQVNLASIAENEVSLWITDCRRRYLDFPDSMSRIRWKPFLCFLNHLPEITFRLNVVFLRLGSGYRRLRIMRRCVRRRLQRSRCAHDLFSIETRHAQVASHYSLCRHPPLCAQRDC